MCIRDSGKVVCFFQSAQKFNSRYATFGFNDTANLDEGAIVADRLRPDGVDRRRRGKDRRAREESGELRNERAIGPALGSCSGCGNSLSVDQSIGFATDRGRPFRASNAPSVPHQERRAKERREQFQEWRRRLNRQLRIGGAIPQQNPSNHRAAAFIVAGLRPCLIMRKVTATGAPSASSA